MMQPAVHTSEVKISPASVRIALGNLLYPSAQRPPSNLAYLGLVDNALGDPTLPTISNRRQYLLNCLLARMITDALACQRAIHDLSPVSDSETVSLAEQAILKDMAYGSPVLIDWSFLYYRYVRVDLNISLVRFGQLLAVEGRTVRRYRSRAILRLTDRMILAEWQVRGGRI